MPLVEPQMTTASDRRILLTGFQPFGEVAVNPTARLMQRVARAAGSFLAAVETIVLDTSYQECERQIDEAIAHLQPDAIVSFGLSARSDQVRLERIAVNIDDASLADTAGVDRRGSRIAAGGPVGYWSTLPLAAGAGRGGGGPPGDGPGDPTAGRPDLCGRHRSADVGRSGTPPDQAARALRGCGLTIHPTPNLRSAAASRPQPQAGMTRALVFPIPESPANLW